MKKEYRVVTEDITVYADSPEDAIEMASQDTGGRVYAVETGLVECEEGDLIDEID